jgi:4-carboxymuconolactone decarboxylase
LKHAIGMMRNARCYTRRVRNLDTQTTRGYPPDVHRDSSSRLPPVQREDLDEAGQRAYDAMTGEGSKLRASLRGPTGFWLHMPEVIGHVRELNWSLRNRENGLSRPLRELTILVTARAHDCQKEWTAHEIHALDAGLDPALISSGTASRPTAWRKPKQPSSASVGNCFTIKR